MITVPFADYPDIYTTGAFGAVVVSGDEFSVRLSDGSFVKLED